MIQVLSEPPSPYELTRAFVSYIRPPDKGGIDVGLTFGDLQRIEAAAAQIQIQGERVPEQLKSLFGR